MPTPPTPVHAESWNCTQLSPAVASSSNAHQHGQCPAPPPHKEFFFRRLAVLTPLHLFAAAPSSSNATTAGLETEPVRNAGAVHQNHFCWRPAPPFPPLGFLLRPWPRPQAWVFLNKWVMEKAATCWLLEVAITVAILAQGTSWAVAVTQAFFVVCSIPPAPI